MISVTTNKGVTEVTTSVDSRQQAIAEILVSVLALNEHLAKICGTTEEKSFTVMFLEVGKKIVNRKEIKND